MPIGSIPPAADGRKWYPGILLLVECQFQSRIDRTVGKDDGKDEDGDGEEEEQVGGWVLGAGCWLLGGISWCG